MPQLIIAAVVIVVAIGIGLVLQRRRQPDVPTQPRALVPTQLDRADFPHREVPWLVVVFSSATCHTCADVVRKANVLTCADVVVYDAEYGAHQRVHQKYAIDAVPIVVVADGQGVVRAGFVGPVTATDLWAAVAEARAPGTSPEPELGR